MHKGKEARDVLANMEESVFLKIYFLIPLIFVVNVNEILHTYKKSI